ncbi:calcium-dependent protein kinase 19-like [Cynara cardunculus var. scolymus]|uniref:calcium-dependent protein kinase 19-like n=1 Tax=Cynara cardunculus var. scolymus TaxID=59895 RepID=UPI000D6259F0|nr:calcium-dependent protein kinase 19-like [Cynara cardunculus var. scolymus]
MDISTTTTSSTTPPPPLEELRQKNPAALTRVDSILGIPRKDINETYKMGRELGRGKFAVTYLCVEKSTGKKYACKSIKKVRLVTEGEKQDVMREVKIMKLLTGQRNVVELRDTFEDKQCVHLVMEYCEGGELFEKMKSKGRYSERIAAQIISSIMKVVYCLHYMGVMHRDLKPENFLLARRKILGFLPCFADYTLLKAIDFGLSTFIDEGKPNQEKVGTAFYVAPEVLRRQGYGKEVDIWSAGVILYMLLTGVPPFYGEKERDIFYAILSADSVLDMKNHPWPSISNNAKELVKKMLSVDPTNRPSAAAVLKHEWLKGNGVAVENPRESVLLYQMRCFRGMNKFKRLALEVIADIVPPEELEELRAMFTKDGTDESGTISHEELAAWLGKHGSDLRPDEVKGIVEAADVNGDGYINYKEFITVMMNYETLHKEEHLLKAFKHFDKDESGFITKEEVRMALEKHMTGDELTQTIEDIFAEVNETGDSDYDLPSNISTEISDRSDSTLMQ